MIDLAMTIGVWLIVLWIAALMVAFVILVVVNLVETIAYRRQYPAAGFIAVWRALWRR